MSEYSEHKAIATYLRIQYPDVIFTSDSSGVRLSIGNAKKILALKANCKIPDLIILHPMGNYSGLVIEIKKIDKSPFLKNGKLRKSEHIQEQNKTLERLSSIGYLATFGVGFKHCKEIIDNYLKGKL